MLYNKNEDAIKNNDNLKNTCVFWNQNKTFEKKTHHDKHNTNTIQSNNIYTYDILNIRGSYLKKTKGSIQKPKGLYTLAHYKLKTSPIIYKKNLGSLKGPEGKYGMFSPLKVATQGRHPRSPLKVATQGSHNMRKRSLDIQVVALYVKNGHQL